MPSPRVTAVIPTLAAGETLWEAVESLRRQTYPDCQIVIVDNSGTRLVERTWPPELPRDSARVLHPTANLGYGEAVNLAFRECPSPYLAVLNDDAAAEPDCLAALAAEFDAHPQAGSAAPQVRLTGEDRLDSAAMRIAIDGTSKQRGAGDPPSAWNNPGDALLASGSAALFRAEMFEDAGGFEPSYFLYCEDTDLGLRARWLGWSCRYVPSAVVHHRYSHSAGRASRRKVFYVERNRLLTIVRNFPLPDLLLALFATPIRYLHHLAALRSGTGAAGAFVKSDSPLALVACVLRAYVSALANLPHAWAARRRILRSARIPRTAFRALLRSHAISLREVAQL